jgi:hypothetical protein
MRKKLPNQRKWCQLFGRHRICESKATGVICIGQADVFRQARETSMPPTRGNWPCFSADISAKDGLAACSQAAIESFVKTPGKRSPLRPDYTENHKKSKDEAYLQYFLNAIYSLRIRWKMKIKKPPWLNNKPKRLCKASPDYISIASGISSG